MTAVIRSVAWMRRARSTDSPIPGRRDRRSGQALIESLLVLVVLAAAFCFFFDFTYGVVARTVLDYSAQKAARADAVGFNDFHRAKAVRVGLMPVSGERIRPEALPFEALRSSVMAYLRSETWGEAAGLLHYERWDTLSTAVRRSGGLTETRVSMDFPVLLPERLGRLFGAVPAGDDPEIRRLESVWRLEDHASDYLQGGNAGPSVPGGTP